MGFALFEAGISVDGGKGLGLNRQEASFTNRTGTALAAGDVVQVDLAASAAESTNFKVGDANSALGNVVAVSAIGARCYPIAIALEPTADNATGNFLLRGVTNTTARQGSGDIPIGTPLTAEAADLELTADAVAGARIVAIAQTLVANADTTATDGGDCTVLFDGLSGFGSVNTTT